MQSLLCCTVALTSVCHLGARGTMMPATARRAAVIVAGLCALFCGVRGSCDSLGYTCDSSRIVIPSGRTVFIGEHAPDLPVPLGVNLVVSPGQKIQLSTTLFVRTDAVTGDTVWFTEEAGVEVVQMTLHKQAMYVGSATPPVGTPESGIFVVGEKASGLTDDGVWARESRINIISPHDGKVIGHQDYVYLAGDRTHHGFLVELTDVEESRIVLTHKQVVIGTPSVGMILRKYAEGVNVVFDGKAVMPDNNFPAPPVVQCIDVPITGVTNILEEYFYPETTGSTCYNYRAADQLKKKTQLSVTTCYSYSDHPGVDLVTNDGTFTHFKAPNGCPASMSLRSMTLHKFASLSECEADTPATPETVELGQCSTGERALLLCRREDI